MLAQRARSEAGLFEGHRSCDQWPSKRCERKPLRSGVPCRASHAREACLAGLASPPFARHVELVHEVVNGLLPLVEEPCDTRRRARHGRLPSRLPSAVGVRPASAAFGAAQRSRSRYCKYFMCIWNIYEPRAVLHASSSLSRRLAAIRSRTPLPGDCRDDASRPSGRSRRAVDPCTARTGQVHALRRRLLRSAPAPVRIEASSQGGSSCAVSRDRSTVSGSTAHTRCS